MPPVIPKTPAPAARFAAAAMRRMFRRRAATSRAAGAGVFMSEDPDKRASCIRRFYTRKAAAHRPVQASSRRNAWTCQASANRLKPPRDARKYRSSSQSSFASRDSDLLDSDRVVAEMSRVRRFAGEGVQERRRCVCHEYGGVCARLASPAPCDGDDLAAAGTERIAMTAMGERGCAPHGAPGISRIRMEGSCTCKTRS